MGPMALSRRAPQRSAEPAQLPLFGRPVTPAARARYGSADLPASRVFAPPGMVEAVVDGATLRAWKESTAEVVRAIERVRSIDEAERVRFAGYEWGEDAAAFADAVSTAVDGAVTSRGAVDARPITQASKRLLGALAWPIALRSWGAGDEARWERFVRDRDAFIVDTVKERAGALWRAIARALALVGGETIVAAPRAVPHAIRGWPVVVIGEPAPDAARGFLARVDAALARLAPRITRVLPGVMESPPPIELRYDRRSDAREVALYVERRRAVMLFAAHRDVARMTTAELARVIAHEVAHDVWQRTPTAAQLRWSAWRASQATRLDVARLARAWRAVGEHLPIDDAARAIAEFDPVLAVQIEGARLVGAMGGMYLTLRSPVAELSPPVSREPISARAAMGDEESFVEALALLVSYGPGAVSVATRAALGDTLPMLRVAKANTARRGLMKYSTA